jgi:hypothetical protein
MTWGAINELSMQSGYRALIRRTRHPPVTTVLSRIMKGKLRHFAFYFNQSRIRLQPRHARLLTSLALLLAWVPVGSPVRGAADADGVCSYLLDDRYGRQTLAEHDSTIARLPGLEWFDLGSRFCRGEQSAV